MNPSCRPLPGIHSPSTRYLPRLPRRCGRSAGRLAWVQFGTGVDPTSLAVPWAPHLHPFFQKSSPMRRTLLVLLLTATTAMVVDRVAEAGRLFRTSSRLLPRVCLAKLPCSQPVPPHRHPKSAAASPAATTPCHRPNCCVREPPTCVDFALRRQVAGSVENHPVRHAGQSGRRRWPHRFLYHRRRLRASEVT